MEELAYYNLYHIILNIISTQIFNTYVIYYSVLILILYILLTIVKCKIRFYTVPHNYIIVIPK